MKKISKIFIVLLVSVLYTTTLNTSVSAQIDYASKESYYRNLCKTSTSYNNNKKACQGFESYLKNKSKQINSDIENINKTIADTKKSIQDLTNAIKENDKLIEAKKIEIEDNKQKVIRVKEDIARKEAEMAEQLVTLQLTSNQNDIVDFVMSASSLEQVIARIEGTTMIQEASNEIVKSMAKLQSELEDTEKTLVADEKRLLDLKDANNKLIVEFRSKEDQLYRDLEKQKKDKSFYNSALNNLNINDVTGGSASKGLIRPVKSSTVTAVAWNYPSSFGGGWHQGVDFASGLGTPIIAPANGVVLSRGYAGSYGNMIVTAHLVNGTVYTFIYAHLQSYLSLTTISQGQTIAYMGSTGNSTGSHVHVEAYKHNTNDLAAVINQYKSTGDYYFGVPYGTVGNCGSVCRVAPQTLFGVSYGQSF